MIPEKLVVGPIQANCYILGCRETHSAIVVDPGAEPKKIKAKLKDLGLALKFIINTHGHVDHIGADGEFSVPVYIHRLDANFLKDPNLSLSNLLGLSLRLPDEVLLLENGQRLTAGEISLEVIHTPGHTPGGICLRTSEFCLTGDTLFAGGIGRCDLPYANEETILTSIREKLLTLPDDTIIYPGHGAASTIGQEKSENPFL
ncbi:MAG: MBL fold metallo-hydrolase [Candidatus Omnitrophica bacterium]|nr:MBL fold metallo-hydrolase [Candidatus Omnitrophota bacterium]